MDDAFTFIGSKAFTGDGAEIRLQGGILRFDIAGSQDVHIIVGNAALKAADFIL